ncbi:PKD domain-containing protein [Symmachiella dynata]|nr:PKD domain-containing protein [Symmachiella dynata]
MSTQPPEADISTLFSRLIGCALPKQPRPRNSRSTDSLKFETLESRLVMSGNLELNGGIEEDNNTGHPQLCGCGCCGAGYLNELNTLELNSTSEESGDGEQFPLESLPLLSSNSNASVKLYLDFDGHFESNWGSYSNITTPAFSLDGDYSSFSTAEINSITEIWQRVSEDYAPFNIDVTTIDPGDFSNGNALRVAIGGNSSWYSSGAGGVAYINTFTNSIVNTVYVFPDNLAKNAKYIAEASSHEAGHGFGLRHQSTYDNGTKTNEYNPGSGDWAPIMGVSYYKARTTWHDGTTTSANTYQDDMAVIARATNGFGYRTDDHGNINSATTLSFAGNNATASGIIERMSDEDAFSFSTTGGQVDLSVNVAEVGANLDSVIELRTASGQLIATADPSGSYGAVISTDVAAGDYVLVVRSTGEYGSVGQYTVSATRSESTATNEIFIAGNTSVAAGGLYTLNLSETNTQSSTISRWTINWGDGNIQTINGNPNTVTHIYAEGPNAFSISATATDAAGTYQSNTLTVDVFDPAPELAISGSSIVAEGSTYVLGLSADGSGAATITQWTINWGDGTIQTINGNPNSTSHVYADGTAAFTIQATATNAAGTFSANALAVTVNNVDATLNISGNSSVAEGNTYTLSLADTDPGADTISSWTINWGDGTIQTINGDPTYATHVYAGSGQYAISATASDEDGSYQSNAVAVNVLEAAPQLSISGTGNTAEGSSYNLTLNADGSGADTITQWTINWGDGTIETVNGNPNSASHVYADGTAAYTIQATATNAAGTFSANNLGVTVNNVAATLNISGDSSVDEGETYTLDLSSTDPGADTITSWTINWGDGTIETINGDPSSATHVYTGGGQYAISATASDEDGSYQSNAVAVNVLAGQNIASPSNLVITGKSGAQLQVQWQDNSTGETAFVIERVTTTSSVRYTSEWVTVGTTEANTTSFTDTVPSAGRYLYRVRAVADVDGDGQSDLFSGYSNEVYVKFKPGEVQQEVPQLNISGAGNTAEGSSYNLTLNADGSGADTIQNWTINWGDGTVETINGNPNSASHVYADGTAAYTIQATATNATGTFSANTLAVTVNNVDATLNIAGNSSIDEGETYTLNLSSTDPGADTITSWTINWGDGTVQTINGDPTYATHVYAGSGQYAISATASDEDGSYQSNAVAVNVHEVAPQLSISGSGNTAEGSTYNLTLNADGSGADTITQWTINWGDGTIETINGNPNSASHVYADGSAAFIIQATATNGAGTVSANNLAVTVNNVAADLNISGFSAVGEGETYTLNLSSTDPGADTISSWTINWGDGTIQTINSDPSTVTHVYGAGGQFTISATASDEDGTYQSNSFGLSVIGAAPQLSISGSGSTAEGSTYNLTLNADGSGADTITQWTINWGDGTIETINGNPNSTSHVYADGSAAFTIQATATNAAGTFSANALAVTVNNVDATLNISGDSSIGEGENYTLDLSSTDPGADTITGWTINWGDGTIQTINGDPSSATHVYNGGGQYTISATASDEDGSYQSNAVAVSVLAGQNIASPSNLVITGKSGAQLQVQWQDNSTGETAFVIERVTTSYSVRYTSEWVTVGTTGPNATSFTDTVPSDGRYLYRVRAVADVDGDGQFDLFSGYSNEVYVKFKPGEVQQTSNNVAAFQSDVTPPSWEHWAMAAESSTNYQPLFSASQSNEIDPRELFFAEYGKAVH